SGAGRRPRPGARRPRARLRVRVRRPVRHRPAAARPAAAGPGAHDGRRSGRMAARAYRPRAGTAMKAVVLTRGLGRRMRAGEVEGLTPEQAAAAAAGLKAMMPVGPPSPAGPRRFLDHVLHELADAGVDR